MTWELEYKESWALKNWCFWTVVLEKTLDSPLNCKEIQPVHLKGNQSWIFIGRTDAEAAAPILWPFDVKNWFTGKDPDSGKDGRQEEKGATENDMVGWHHWLNGHDFEKALGAGDGQGILLCCSPWVAKSRTRLNDWTELNLNNREKRKWKTATVSGTCGLITKEVTFILHFLCHIRTNVGAVNTFITLFFFSIGLQCQATAVRQGEEIEEYLAIKHGTEGMRLF